MPVAFSRIGAESPGDGSASQEVRTDLALEAREVGTRAPDVSGVSMDVEQTGPMTVTRIRVETDAAAKQIGKAKGLYATLEVPELRQRDPELQERVAERFGEELARFIRIPADGVVLVIGLGNWNVTPDALGPLVVEDLFVTRHLFSLMPDVANGGFRSVCAVAPGVLGITGIETLEIVLGVVEHVKPDLVIAVDALAARSIDRVNTTIQIADSGIHPGTGVGNQRRALNRGTLGVDVVAVGVPTVVDAATIASDAMDMLLKELEDKVPGNGAGRILNQFTSDQKRSLVSDVLSPLGNNLIVTPKEIDEFVEDTARVVAMGMNVALHPAMTMEDAKNLTY